MGVASRQHGSRYYSPREIICGLLAVGSIFVVVWSLGFGAQITAEKEEAVILNERQRLNLRRNRTVLAVERVGPAVVSLTAERVIDEPSTQLFAEPGTPDISTTHRTVLGSGLIIHPAGFVVTNHHVVRRASLITVRLRDGSEFPCELINWDRDSDLAVIRIQGKSAEGFPNLPLGRSEDLLVGEKVIAVGNPFGLGESVTTGVVSALRRPIIYQGRVLYRDLIQTDALINPGNSGGPLLNILGEIIGINTGIIASGQGLSFAIPADVVRRTLAKLFDFRDGRMIHIGLAADMLFADKEKLESRGSRRGIRVRGVEPGSPAAAASLKAGDLILAIDNEPVTDLFELNFALFNRSVGDRVVLDILRRDKSSPPDRRSVPVTLARKKDMIWQRLGLVVRNVTEDLGRRLQLPRERWYGVYISEVDPDGPAAQISVSPGDLIHNLGKYQINGLESLRSILETGKLDAGSLVTVNLYRYQIGAESELAGTIRLRK